MKISAQSISSKFSKLEVEESQKRQVKGGGWGNDTKDVFKNCPPPNSGVW